ncbi:MULTISPECIES: 3-hydroxybutyrate dehydrogenase [unclassified Oceanobacter]|jgi:3-hydroxybutyrate dehydrogenase|uniref:3-hydroxybutyrate dehydrogenase n=2 Tax=Gammaproteobacteria TaxID=1236 RepID=UPI0026E2C070|nr:MULTISPECIES: 3-hydroxybutyrate dehydrogenase [unclassified Oceanobacter]MDO6681884.1 3-hydroxybutyrate dehydrogenase [Oceanobacter sp. 5_MG-2023]MDP2505246.1 3-hydroxybutyrate dehydrogenase [Oceanobacter sp. 3_MG-2023]MDP2549262.1 3-hydroxybutyrate dehydrogenase [Oceanobacter sp. 4_MG-2023]MDP2607929.1 3-hydroxybutyrate dehydrogenase [Oceanobacter sp. 1_MG-2023]MDP2611409.1 3-hydroxybutyrate dehydrogenase [Oceanobacter sp. 2_MG-2023]
MNKLHILITGGASGIGLGIAEHLGKQGARIVISDISQEALDKGVLQLQAAGIDASTAMADMSDVTAIDALASQFANDPINVVINNAGLQFVSRLEDFPADRWKLLIDVMLVGPAMLSRALLPAMREQGFGRIINIGSIHSLVASPYKSAYVAAKHGLIGFSKTLALETGDTDITVNTICPSYVKTPLVEKQIAAQAKENGISEEEVINKIMLEPMPKKQFIDISEIAGTVAFLASPAAKNITGQTMVLDGGWVAR